MSGHYCKGF